MKNLTQINRSICLLALILGLLSLAACGSSNPESGNGTPPGTVVSPGGGTTGGPTVNTTPTPAKPNKSNKLCGDQATDDKDPRCSEKPDKFGLSFAVTKARIPESDPFSCPATTCLGTGGYPPNPTYLENHIGKLYKGNNLIGGISYLLTHQFEPARSGEEADIKLVFEFDGIDPTKPEIAIDKPFKIYVWSHDKNNKVDSEIIDSQFSSKSFFSNARINKDGYLTTDPGTLIIPIFERSNLTTPNELKTFIYLQNAYLSAKIDLTKTNIELKDAIIYGDLLKPHMTELFTQIESICNLNCTRVCFPEGKDQDNKLCSYKPLPKATCTPGTPEVCGSALCLNAYSTCSRENDYLTDETFTKSVDGEPHAAAPMVIEINKTAKFTIEESQFK